MDRWRRRHALPVASLPDGRVATTKNLLEQWLMSRIGVKARMNQSPGRPKGGGTKKQEVTPDTSKNGGKSEPESA